MDDANGGNGGDGEELEAEVVHHLLRPLQQAVPQPELLLYPVDLLHLRLRPHGRYGCQTGNQKLLSVEIHNLRHEWNC